MHDYIFQIQESVIREPQNKCSCDLAQTVFIHLESEKELNSYKIKSSKNFVRLLDLLSSSTSFQIWQQIHEMVGLKGEPSEYYHHLQRKVFQFSQFTIVHPVSKLHSFLFSISCDIDLCSFTNNRDNTALSLLSFDCL